MTTFDRSPIVDQNTTKQISVADRKHELDIMEPVLAKATSLLFNSGNVVASDRLKKKTNLNPQDELIDVLNSTLSNWVTTVDRSQIQENKSVICRHPDIYEKINENEKDDISVSVKLFLNNLDPEILNQAIKTILDEIGVDRIDTLIISFPEKIFNQENLPAELVIPIWSIVQKYIEAKQILTAGLSDFNAKYLEQFLNAIGDRNKNPSLNQVNITACCKMPEDLVECAKINNIQLTTHIDPRELLTVETLQSIIRKHLHDFDSNGWIHLWCARYTLILKGRGIVKSKGYIVNGQRELKYTK